MIFTPRSHVCIYIYIYILKKNCDDLVGGRPGCSRWLHLVGMLSMAGLVVALPSLCVCARACVRARVRVQSWYVLVLLCVAYLFGGFWAGGLGM